MDGPNRAPLAGPSWTRGQAAGIERGEATVTATFSPPASAMGDGVSLWDTWLLRERDGSVATVGGRRFAFALTAPAEVLPGKRHDVATIRCFSSTDGRTWHDAGVAFDPEAAFGSRQWAGCALIEDGRLYVYYTAAGRRGESELTYGQRIAVATGGRIEAGDAGPAIVGPWEHSVLLEPDGRRYETPEQSRGMTSTFRDPWFFEDPATGRTCLLFEANVPVPAGSDACGGDPELQAFNGAVGVATSPTGDPTAFELRAPLLDGICVNQELERPHLVVREGTYYLFVSTHRHTFAPGIEGFDGLYGFAADSLWGDYEPLNGSGLVVANPDDAPFQAYSWLAYPGHEEVLVASFLNYYDYDRPTLDDVADLPPSEQIRRFGGTLAPTVRLDVTGRRTRILGTLDPGHLPLPDEPLPEPDWPPDGGLATGEPEAADGGEAKTAGGYAGRRSPGRRAGGYAVREEPPDDHGSREAPDGGHENV